MSRCAFSSLQTFRNFSSPRFFPGECLEFAYLYRCPGPSLFSIFHKFLRVGTPLVLAGTLLMVYLVFQFFEFNEGSIRTSAIWSRIDQNRHYGQPPASDERLLSGLGLVTWGKSGIELARFHHVLPSDCFECCLQARFTYHFGFLAIVLRLAKVIRQVFSLFGQDGSTSLSRASRLARTAERVAQFTVRDKKITVMWRQLTLKRKAVKPLLVC